MPINREEIKKEYRDKLKVYHRKIKELSPEDSHKALDIAKNYYAYLAKSGIPYAKLALEVIENQGRFGKLVNIHLKSQSVFEGIKPENIGEVREKIIISLASHDAKLRSDKNYHPNKSYYKEIEDYHIKVFKYHTSPYAWGGLTPKELIGSGSWMNLYEEDAGIFEAIKGIMQNPNKGRASEYSTERLLKSVAHSYKSYQTGFDTPFELKISTLSKEQASLIWKINPNRITEIESDNSMLDDVSSKIFKAEGSKEYICMGEPDYESSDSEGEEDLHLGANKIINTQLTKLLSDPAYLKQYQEQSINDALKDLKLAEGIIPNITEQCLGYSNENKDFLQELMGIKDPDKEIKKVKKSESMMEGDFNHSYSNQNQSAFKKSLDDDLYPDNNIEDNQDWLNSIMSNTQTAMNDAQNDPEMQQFLQSLGQNNGFDFGEDA